MENDQAKACVRAALDVGITFDNADAYANTQAETVLGEALKGERRESLEILTKVYWPTGSQGHNDLGLSRKHIMDVFIAVITEANSSTVAAVCALGTVLCFVVGAVTRGSGGVGY